MTCLCGNLASKYESTKILSLTVGLKVSVVTSRVLSENLKTCFILTTSISIDFCRKDCCLAYLGSDTHCLREMKNAFNITSNLNVKDWKRRFGTYLTLLI